MKQILYMVPASTSLIGMGLVMVTIQQGGDPDLAGPLFLVALNIGVLPYVFLESIYKVFGD